MKKKMHLFARQGNGSEIDKNDRKNQWSTLQIALPHTLLSRSGP